MITYMFGISNIILIRKESKSKKGTNERNKSTINTFDKKITNEVIKLNNFKLLNLSEFKI